MKLPRKPYYEKELTLRLARSYGPWRYDPMYEEAVVDYPVGYVRIAPNWAASTSRRATTCDEPSSSESLSLLSSDI